MDVHLLKALVFGDAHIPNRRDAIPKDFYDHIAKTKYEIALITGDLVREHDMRKALPALPRSFIVQGNMDYSTNQYNHHEQIQLGEFNILLLHGTQLRPRGNVQQLWEIVTNVDADIAIHGHTHNATIDLYNDKLFLNPGTISGATGGWSGRQEASFIEMDIVDYRLKVTLFTSNWDVLKESEINFIKEESIIHQA